MKVALYFLLLTSFILLLNARIKIPELKTGPLSLEDYKIIDSGLEEFKNFVDINIKV